MGLLKVFFLFFILSLFGCARMVYIIDQGAGQLRLLVRGRDNHEVLSDANIPKEHKDKIKKIQNYKNYFYSYWKKKGTSIYSKTTFLEQKAVTYLVVASKFNEIRAREECFPIMGCFPYLGFFEEKKAKRYAQKLKNEGFETYLRPVFAYSTLGYFNDRILSSFFHYSDYDLAELVFHELFHTIFFIKDEVEFNENLANYFGRVMAFEYFKFTQRQKLERESWRLKHQKLSLAVVKMAKKLDREYKERPFLDQKKADELKDSFLIETFYPHMKKLCTNLGLSRCFPLEQKWNNASLAAFLTYESKGNKIAELRKRLKLGLLPFFHYIEGKYQKYRKSDKEISFSYYLLN